MARLCHSRMYTTSLNPLTNDCVMQLWKFQNFSFFTHFLWSRDELEGSILNFVICRVEGYLWAKNDDSSWSGLNRDTHTHTYIHTYTHTYIRTGIRILTDWLTKDKLLTLQIDLLSRWRPMQARQRAASSRLLLYQLCPSVRPSVRPSVTLLGSAKTVRDSALVTMGS